MEIHKPLRAAVFSYELLRLLLLTFSFGFFPSLQAVLRGGFFPYLVYVSPNALFPLICFFFFLRPGEYRNYLPLYMAGKSIAVILFYVWIAFSFTQDISVMESSFLEPMFPGVFGYNEMVILLGGAFLISLGDAFSVFGAWILNKKQVTTDGKNGGGN